MFFPIPIPIRMPGGGPIPNPGIPIFLPIPSQSQSNPKSDKSNISPVKFEFRATFLENFNFAPIFFKKIPIPIRWSYKR